MCSTNYLINIMLTTKESRVESHMSWAKETVKTTFDNQYLSAVPGKEFWSAQCWQKEIPGAAALTDTVTISTTHFSWLLFVPVTLKDQDCENEQEEVGWHSTDFGLSSEVGGPDGKACGTALCFMPSCGIQPQGWAHPSITQSHSTSCIF